MLGAFIPRAILLSQIHVTTLTNTCTYFDKYIELETCSRVVGASNPRPALLRFVSDSRLMRVRFGFWKERIVVKTMLNSCF